jgi:DNA-binding IclR family transcriptional regulator
MPKKLTNIYPKLRGLMAERNENVDDLVSVLGISDDTIRRSLKGLRNFNLIEARALSNRYEIGIEELFKEDFRFLLDMERRSHA